MEVHFPPDLEAKLNQKAMEQGRDTESLVYEAVERFIEHDEWFVREVEKGLAQIERGDVLDWLEKKFAGHIDLSINFNLASLGVPGSYCLQVSVLIKVISRHMAE